ncbi:MAG: Hsp20/alpha crystallin family protein [Candidatus Dadabacteria bacterium]|nr:MAG: Hsp20/alpha crystallin family protein [Candidatus Dadabacteria bacterium]
MRLRDLVPWKGQSSKVPVRYEQNPIAAFQQEMNRLFNSFFSESLPDIFGSFGKGLESFTPKVNVKDTDKAIIVTAEVPGMTEDDVDLRLTDDYLVIRGEKRHEDRQEEDGAYYVESSYGAFERVVPLGVQIDHDNVEAEMKKGILKITLPKSMEARKEAKKISIKSA